MSAALLRLAPIAALWLTLSGAAAPITAQALAECRASHEEALTALPTFTVEDRSENSRPEGNQVITGFLRPDDLRVFGLTPLSFGTVESFDGKREHLLIMTLYPLSFDEVEAAAVKGHGHSACPMPDTSNGRNCFVFMRKSGEWTTRLVVRQYGDKAGIGCSYMRTRE